MKPQRLRAMKETWLAVFSDSGYKDENDDWVAAASPFTATEHHIALTLATYMSPNGDSCYPSVPRLAIGSGRADSTVRDALNKLVEFGFLVRVKRRGRGNSNEYVAAIPPYFAWDVPAEENRRRAAVFASGHEQLVTGPAVVRVPDAAVEPDEETAGERRFSSEAVAGDDRRSGSLKPPEGPTETAGVRRGSNQDHPMDHPMTEESPDGASSVPPADAAGERARLRLNIELALTAELGAKPLTRSERGAWEKAIAELVEIAATPELVRSCCAVYRRKWPAMELTPNALTRWWGMLSAAVDLGEARDPAERTREAWIEKTAWRMDEEDVRWIMLDAGATAAEIEAALEHRARVLAERSAESETLDELERRVA